MGFVFYFGAHAFYFRPALGHVGRGPAFADCVYREVPVYFFVNFYIFSFMYRSFFPLLRGDTPDNLIFQFM